MAAPNPLQAMRVPGRLVADPTTLADPASGTLLGLLQDAAWVRREGRAAIVAAEYGIEVVDELYLGEVWGFSCALRGWDGDAVTRVFPNTFLGTLGGVRGVRYPGTVRAGSLASARAFRLLFAPDDAARHPGVVLYRCLPRAVEELEVPFRHDQELLLRVDFLAIRDAAGKLGEVQLLEDMTAP